MKIVVAILMGFLLGILTYMMSAMLFVSVSDGEIPTYFFCITLIGGWGLTSWIILYKVKTLSMVFSRGFLIGAAGWFIMILVGFIYSGIAVTGAVSESGTSDAATAGAAIGGGLVIFFTGGISIIMASACLVGFAISYFMGREMKPETNAPTKKCPECAEMIQAEAKKCRYCGTALNSID